MKDDYKGYEFFIDWKYPAFHLVLEDQTKKPPLNTPYVIDRPPGVMKSLEMNPQSLVLHPEMNKVRFNCYKVRVRSRVNHNRALIVWVYAPNMALARKYCATELKIKALT